MHVVVNFKGSLGANESLTGTVTEVYGVRSKIEVTSPRGGKYADTSVAAFESITIGKTPPPRPYSKENLDAKAAAAESRAESSVAAMKSHTDAMSAILAQGKSADVALSTTLMISHANAVVDAGWDDFPSQSMHAQEAALLSFSAKTTLRAFIRQNYGDAAPPKELIELILDLATNDRELMATFRGHD